MLRRWEWLILLCGAVVSAAIGAWGAKSDTASGLFWGIAAGLVFMSIVAWLYAREKR